MLPSSIDFDTTKKNMLLSFAIDEGFNYPQSVSNVMMLDVNRDRTFCKYKTAARLRLAWSLIKCGVKYEYGKFYHEIDNKLIYGDLTTMLNYILNPILEFGSK